jgi:SsrA-binding protein
MSNDSIKTIAQNKKARHEYFIETAFEAGISLSGTEVKSVRSGSVNLKDSYAVVEKGEVFVYKMHISPYEQGNIYNKDPLRIRKLLMHRYEINKLIGYIQQKGYTLIPLSVYLKGSLVKVQLAVAKGKQTHDKRHDIAERDAKRDIERQFRGKE